MRRNSVHIIVEFNGIWIEKGRLLIEIIIVDYILDPIIVIK